jgi:hypothetical protein
MMSQVWTTGCIPLSGQVQLYSTRLDSTDDRVDYYMGGTSYAVNYADSTRGAGLGLQGLSRLHIAP